MKLRKRVTKITEYFVVEEKVPMDETDDEDYIASDMETDSDYEDDNFIHILMSKAAKLTNNEMRTHTVINKARLLSLTRQNKGYTQEQWDQLDEKQQLAKAWKG